MKPQVSAGALRRDLLTLCDQGQFLAAHMRLHDSRIDPHVNPSLWELLERQATEAGEEALAHRLRAELLAADVANEDIILSEARYQIESGDPVRARILLEKTFGGDPRPRQARILLGIALAADAPRPAVALLDSAQHGTETEMLWAVDALRGMGELRRAMALCEVALGRYPKHAGFLNRLGWIAEGLGDLDRAVSVAEESMDGDVESRVQALTRLVRLHRRLGGRQRMLDRAADLLRLDASPLHKLRLASMLGQNGLLLGLVGALPRAYAKKQLSRSEAEKIFTFLLDEGQVGLALHLRREGFPVAPAVRRVLERSGFGDDYAKSLPRRLDEAAALRSPELLFPLKSGRAQAPLPPGWFPALREDTPILLVNSVLAAGGAERQFLMVARALVAAGVAPGRLHAALFSIEGERGHDHFEDDLRATGINVHDLSGRDVSTLVMPEREMDMVALFPARLRGDVLALYQLAQELKPAVLHGWQDRASVAAGLVGRMLNVQRTVLSVRNMRPQKRGEEADWIVRAVYREVLEAPSVAITANADEGARDYEAWLGLARGKVTTLANAVDDVFFASPDARAVRRDGPLRLLGVFRLAENKRPTLWLETVATLRRVHGIDLAPRIVGTGPLADEVRRHAEKVGLHDLRLDPPVPNPAEIYRESDMLLLMSQVEGTPNVVLEAQASGLPVAACRVGGVSGALYRGGQGGGLLLDPDIDAGTAAQAIARWLPSARSEDPAARIAFIRENYSTEALAGTLLGLYGAST